MSYLRDIRSATTSSAGYPAAFAAQILNQQLFFHHFPDSREESLRRIEALLGMIRDRHPELVLVMSPVPSYQLVDTKPVDRAFVDVLARLEVTYDSGVAEEHGLYEQLRTISESSGWVFVDNLSTLQGYRGSDRLYNAFDYHITRTAMELIGRNQAAALSARLQLDGEL